MVVIVSWGSRGIVDQTGQKAEVFSDFVESRKTKGSAVLRKRNCSVDQSRPRDDFIDPVTVPLEEGRGREWCLDCACDVFLRGGWLDSSMFQSGLYIRVTCPIC